MVAITTRNGVDESAFLNRLRAGDARAVAELIREHARLITLLIARVFDEASRSPAADQQPLRDAVARALCERLPPMALEWPEGAQLNFAIASIVRPVCEDFLYEPGAITKDFRGLELIERLQVGLDTLSPKTKAAVRMQLLGLEPRAMGALLGSSVDWVVASLREAADRLAAVQLDWEPEESARLLGVERHGVDFVRTHELADAQASWRDLLAVGEPVELVRLALDAEDRPHTRAIRDRADELHRLIKRPLDRGRHPEKECEQGQDIAAFVDGSLRGAERVRMERHLLECRRCLDAAALLRLDMDAASLLRFFGAVSDTVAVAAICLSTHRSSIAEELAEAQVHAGATEALALLRCARAATVLQMGGLVATPENSRVVPLRAKPSPQEAPLAAIEALVAGGITEARRALQSLGSAHPLSRRMSLLADAAGHDLAAANEVATAIVASSGADPALRYDAEMIAALPKDRCLPHDLVIGRLHTFLPTIVQTLFSSRD